MTLTLSADDGDDDGDDVGTNSVEEGDNDGVSGLVAGGELLGALGAKDLGDGAETGEILGAFFGDGAETGDILGAIFGDGAETGDLTGGGGTVASVLTSSFIPEAQCPPVPHIKYLLPVEDREMIVIPPPFVDIAFVVWQES